MLYWQQKIHDILLRGKKAKQYGHFGPNKCIGSENIFFFILYF